MQALLSVLYFRYSQSGQALTWRYGWSLTSPFYLHQLGLSIYHCPLLLIAGELIANVFSHAFPDERNGSIQIGFHALGTSEWELLVSDDGVGIQPNRPTEQGGLLVAEALADQAGAKISFDGGPGTAVRVKIASL